MPMKGDTRRLGELREQLSSAGRKVTKKAALSLEDVVEEVYSSMFASSSDPWGAFWKPSASNPMRPMFRTGELAASSVRGSASGRVSLRLAKHWIFQQVGANGMTPRAVAPFSHGSTWDPAIEAQIDDVIAEHFS